MDQNLLAIIVAVAGTLITTVVIWGTKKIVSSIQKIQDDHEHVRKATIGMLRRDMYEICEDALSDGCITRQELRDVEYLFEEYSKLGGNGAMKQTVEKVRQLKVVPYKKHICKMEVKNES